MSGNGIRITSPRDGDILTRHDGTENDDGLTLTVSGEAPAGVDTIVVQGNPVAVKEGRFTSNVCLNTKRTIIRASILPGGPDHAIEVWWNRKSDKRFRFSVDDNICFLRDLAEQRPASLFDHWYLRFWREMHQQYGAKIHLNIYYQTDGFDLTQMPDIWKDEWETASEWLHLTFHALQDKPDRPYRNACYGQMAHDCDLVMGHIRRFAGNAVIGRTTTVHWAECPKDAARALRDRGLDQLIALYDRRDPDGSCTTSYYLPIDACDYCDTRGAWRDRETGITFIRCAMVVNAIELDQIESILDARTATPQTSDMVELLIHEQYFRKELAFYRPDMCQRVEKALDWVTTRGYRPVFWSDGFLGVPD